MGSVLILLTSCLGQDRRYVEIQTGLPIVEDVFRKAKASGSLVYRPNCDGVPTFPRVHAPTTPGVDPVRALSEVFADDPMMRVREDAGGRIRIFETDVLRDLLEVKIAHISFNVPGPYIALHFILSTPEVRAFMRDQKIRPIEEDTFEIPGSGFSGPLVSGDLENTNVSQALDYVVQRTPGFWIYASCPDNQDPRARRVSFSFSEN